MTEIEELVLGTIDAWNRMDADGLAALCTEDVELYLPRNLLEGGGYRGTEGIQRAMADARDSWDEVTVEFREVRSKGDRGVVHAHITRRSHSSGPVLGVRGLERGAVPGRLAELTSGLYLDEAAILGLNFDAMAATREEAEMTDQQTGPHRGLPDDVRASVRAMWALGDYNRFATELDSQFGDDLVAACGIGAGQRVLDVAAGSGNVAIRAAEAGADVVASDITVENMKAGEREASERGVELEWVEGDAQALPFGDGEFDVVTSSAGAMFAPDQQAVADELLRVCRPGGTIGMANFTPSGLAAEFFGVLGPYMPPPPPEAPSPLLWGDEAHVGQLFGDRVSSLEASERQLVETVPGTPADFCDFYRQTFGPVIAAFASVEHDPERSAALERELLDFVKGANAGSADGPTELRFEYLLVLARKQS